MCTVFCRAESLPQMFVLQQDMTLGCQTIGLNVRFIGWYMFWYRICTSVWLKVFVLSWPLVGVIGCIWEKPDCILTPPVQFEASRNLYLLWLIHVRLITEVSYVLTLCIEFMCHLVLPAFLYFSMIMCIMMYSNMHYWEADYLTIFVFQFKKHCQSLW